MEHVEALLNVITFILKTLDNGQVDNLDIELLKSFSFSHLVIAESLKASTNDVEDDNNDDDNDNNVEDDNIKDKCENIDQERSAENDVPENKISESNEVLADIESINFDESSINADSLADAADIQINELPQIDHHPSPSLESVNVNDVDLNMLESEEFKIHDEPNNPLHTLVFRCLFCDLEFSNEIDFRRHDNDSHIRDGQFLCVCGRPFSDKKNAVNHYITYHSKKKNQTESLSEKLEKKKVGLLIFRCLFCDVDFKDQEKFNIHDSEKHLKDGKFHCVCQEAFRNKRDAVNHFMVFHNKKNIYPCSYCTESFFQIQDLRNHLKMTHDKLVPSQQCPICLDGATFVPESKIRSHIQTEHRTAKFTCDICKRNLSTNNALEKHIKQIHSSKKTKYTCEVCEKDYYARHAFDNHVAKHNGEPTFQCQQCSKKCYTALYLRRHELDNHKNGDKRVFCTQCDYSTKTIGALRVHMSGIHTDERAFDCDSCGGKFKNKNALSSHKNIHRARKHKCKYCDKLFVESSQLKIHIDIHEENYRYFCKVCDKKFIQCGNLKLHMRKHHTMIN